MDCLDDRAAEDLGNIVAAYLEFDFPEQAAEAIAHFYRDVMGVTATVHQASSATVVHVPVGIGQEFIFHESDRPIADYDGHHLQVYLADFSGPHREPSELSLIKEECDQQQYRVENVVDSASGETTVFTIEHEIRSMRHPLFMRLTVNRNPGQSRDYAPGHDPFLWATPSD